MVVCRNGVRALGIVAPHGNGIEDEMNVLHQVCSAAVFLIKNEYRLFEPLIAKLHYEGGGERRLFPTQSHQYMVSLSFGKQNAQHQ